MNPQLNKVFSKLAKEDKKTELASEKVELTIIQDLKSGLNKTNSQIDALVKSEDKLDKAINAANKVAEELKSVNKDSKYIMSDISNVITLFEQKTKELGLSANDNKTYKELVKNQKELKSLIVTINKLTSKSIG